MQLISGLEEIIRWLMEMMYMMQNVIDLILIGLLRMHDTVLTEFRFLFWLAVVCLGYFLAGMCLTDYCVF